MRRRAVLAAALLLAGCQLGPTFGSGDASVPRRAYGTLAEGGSPTPTTRFTPRRGPGTNPWADAWAGGPAPFALGPMRGTLAITDVAPDLVIDGRAIYDDGSALVALDLATGGELWRITDDRRLASRFMTTDGSRICGVTAASAYTGDITYVCLAMDDGRELMRDGTGSYFGTGGETQRLVDLEIRGGLLYTRVWTTLIVYDIATGGRVFTGTADGSVWRGFVVAGDDLVIVGAGDGLQAVDAQSGAPRATYAPAGPVAYLLQSGGEAIFVQVAFGSPFAVAYDPASDTFRDAPEWAWAAGYGGITEPLADGTAFAMSAGRSSGTLVELDLGARTVGASYDTQQGSLRIHTNAVMATTTFGFEALPRGGATVPAAAFHYESWSFRQGPWHDLP